MGAVKEEGARPRRGSDDGSTACGTESTQHSEQDRDLDRLQAKVLEPGGNNCSKGECAMVQGAMGNYFPAFWKPDEIEALREQWVARVGDVFVISHFPIRGLQRLLVALVEGREEDAWAPGLIDKPHFVEAAACRRGTQSILQEIEAWEGRRLFKSHCLPSTFPCKYPFEERKAAEGPPPKIMVLVADPRHAVTMAWNFFADYKCMQKGEADWNFPAFIHAVASGKFRWFACFWRHSRDWAEEALKNPDSVRLFDAGRLGSMDPKEVRAELESIAEFLEIDPAGAEKLAGVAFRPPENVFDVKDYGITRDAMRDGFLVEQSGRNLHCFENTVNGASSEVLECWHNILRRAWLQSEHPLLSELAKVAMRGVHSLPVKSLVYGMKGEAAHNDGRCRPCVFALRDICKNTEEMCLYCHSKEHSKTKRASLRIRRKKAREKDQIRVRTPSPSPTQSPRGGAMVHPALQEYALSVEAAISALLQAPRRLPPPAIPAAGSASSASGAAAQVPTVVALGE